MHIKQYLYLFPSFLSALSWLSGNTGSSSMLVWQTYLLYTSKSHLDLCTAGCQTSALSGFAFLFCMECARGLLPVFAALGRIIIISQVLCMHLVVCIKLMGCALFSCWKEVIKIPGKSFWEGTSLKFLLFMPSVCEADTRWQFLHKSLKVSDGKNSIIKPGEQPRGLTGVMSNPSSFVCSLNHLALCLRS